MPLSRRDLLRNAGVAALALPLAACVTDNKAKKGGGESATATATATAGAVSAANPFGVDAARPLEVVVFSGGNGEKYATDVHEVLYRKEFPQSSIKHGATQKIGTTLRPRFISGDVPDVVNNSGPEALDLQSLVAEGQVADLSALFEAPAIGFDGKKIKDVVIGGVYESSLIGGVPRVLQYSVGHRALWYNAKLFEAKGWKVPTTWDEFKALGQTAKADGRALFAYPGQVGPFYQLWNLLYTAAKIGGNKTIVDIDNLADGAWQAPAVLQAATAWVEIQTDFGDKSYFGLDHTQTQVRQLQDKILFYPCGSWIEGEMAKDKPATFEYALAPIPSVTAADAMPYGALMVSGTEAFFVSAKGRNPRGGLEYLRLMLSKEGSHGYTEKTGNLTVIPGTTDGLTLSSALTSAAKAMDAAGKNIITDARFETWYKELFDEGKEQINAVMSGRISPKQFCDAMQKKADSLKKDSSVPKQNRTV